MAIQMRRGEYDDFDASKMLAGELAVVVSGDPETEGGALYVATAAGSATRVAFANEVPGDATTTSDGLMSAADKAKLDGIAAGAKKVTITETTRGSGAQVVSFTVQNPDGTFEFPPTAVKADSNGYVDMTSVANGSIPNSKLATPYTHPSYTARTGQPTGNQTPAFGGTFSVSQVTSDATGHVTGLTERTVKIPDAIATSGAAGLMSAADKARLDGMRPLTQSELAAILV